MWQTVFFSLLLVVVDVPLLPLPSSPAAVDDAKAAAAGIRKLPGKRLTLYTDASGSEIDRLLAAFDQAFSQWCRYFRVKEEDWADWHMTGFLMRDKARFLAAGLLPADLPPFEHGFSRDYLLWLYEQPSDYYRRHLLLHEGTHGFMNTVLGGCGPHWYMEGMAEYLATHRRHDGQLTLGYMPRTRDEVPEWGRIRIIQDAVAAGRTLQLREVVQSPATRAQNTTEPYAWCWAVATLLDRHPRYQGRFRQMAQLVKRRDFNEQFFRLFESDWQELCEEWQLMVANLEYGYDVARSAVDFTPGTISAGPRAGEGPGVRAVTIAANRGWQNSGLRLEAGGKYQLTATGRYQVATTSAGPRAGEGPGVRVWWCEPNGVSIRYYHGLPLGILLAAVRPDNPPPDSASALLHPTVVGLGTTLRPTETGTLFLKVNDSAGELGDNAGELSVEVRRR